MVEFLAFFAAAFFGGAVTLAGYHLLWRSKFRKVE